ncbi:LGFP repeat-containing protein [Microlunatus sp. Y2014]|uniref:LGFP repeat-containing protein n=1 Tax=Microlunatus sp. Y2014 TaxID=3418488 RepID=UPI003DA78A30
MGESVARCDAAGCRLDITTQDAISIHESTGAHYIGGPFKQRWDELGGAMGYPATQINCGLMGAGCYQHYTLSSSIYYSTDTGAKTIRGSIRNKWASLGWERSSLGYPSTDENCGLVRGGCYNHFENSGSIYYSAAHGSHVVRGSIRNKWASMGWELSPLGYPTNDEGCGLARGGCFNNFEFQGSSIYYSPGTGSHVVKGSIRNRWGGLGWENGRLGYPSTDELCGLAQGGCYNHFEGGSIYYAPPYGSHPIWGAFHAVWSEYGRENGVFGYPTAGEAHPGGTSPASHRIQVFEHGFLYWDGVNVTGEWFDPASGATIKRTLPVDR